MIKKVCSFFGHRTINVTNMLIDKIRNLIEDLIVNQNALIFLFGSRSEFDSLCHGIVTELKEKYKDIERYCYTCRHESCTLESEREYWEGVYSRFHKREVHLLGVEKEVEHKTKYTSGRASYVERNQAMIDASDICIFYYDELYQPEMRKYSKRSIYYQPKSGTKIAYDYSKMKKKVIYNVYDK